MITRLDIAGDLIGSLRDEQLTREQLLAYCEAHGRILQRNIEQALPRHQVETLGQVVDVLVAQYAADKERILANYTRLGQVADRMSERIVQTYGHQIPDIVLVSCVGLYANGGWAQRVDDRSTERKVPGALG